MARANYVKKARKAVPSAGIQAGESYWWWQFAYQGKRYSKTKPKRSQLTRSAYYQVVYDLVDDTTAPDFDPDFDLDAWREELAEQTQEIHDTCEESLENMPDQLRDSDSGNTLQERMEACYQATCDLEALDVPEKPDDVDLDDPKAVKDAMQKFGIDGQTPDGWDALLEAIEREKEQYQEAWEGFTQEALDALSNLEV